MSSRIRQLAKEVSALSPGELVDFLHELEGDSRDTLREALEAETTDEVDAAWVPEIQRRLKSIKDGTAVLVSWEEVEAEIDQILAK